MAPLIGIPASISVREKGIHSGSEQYFASSEYVAAILKTGGIPVIMPTVSNLAVLRRQVEIVQGLLLIGGHDLDPLLYGEEPLPKLGPVFPARDEYEIAAVKFAVEQSKPVFGICRGIQVINVAFGGTLYQDLSLMADPILQHNQKSRSAPGHSVQVGGETLLGGILLRNEVRANSYHHQALKDVAPSLTVSARSKDGVIEGVENKEIAVLGVQWHPEMMIAQCPEMLRLFGWLVDSATGD